ARRGAVGGSPRAAAGRPGGAGPRGPRCGRPGVWCPPPPPQPSAVNQCQANVGVAQRVRETVAMALVVVDAENVRRSLWPNLSQNRLVTLAREWADAEGHELLIVFDGPAPADAPELVSTGAESADDWIARAAPGLARPWWLVTSDRELRDRAGAT